jgi:hypothetical protein
MKIPEFMLLAYTGPHPGVDSWTLSRWERGLRTPTGRHARLAEAFDERFARQDQPSTTCSRPTAPQTCGALRGGSPLQTCELQEPQ